VNVRVRLRQALQDALSWPSPGRRNEEEELRSIEPKCPVRETKSKDMVNSTGQRAENGSIHHSMHRIPQRLRCIS
jgi:hypothetical protein